MAAFVVTPDMAHSVHQSVQVPEDYVIACDRCEQALIPSEGSYFRTIRGPCDCSWACCAHSKASRDHAPHMTARALKPGEVPLVQRR